MTRLDRTHAKARTEAYGIAIKALEDTAGDYRYGDSCNRELAIEAEFLMRRLEREMATHIEKYSV